MIANVFKNKLLINFFNSPKDDIKIIMNLISNLRKYIFFSAFALFLIGCASSRIDWRHSNIVSALPTNLQGATVSIYPLDKRKAGKIETDVIQRHLTNELNKIGVKEVDPRQQIPTYFVLFDYGSELGITTNYEHALLIIAYSSSSPPKQVYKAKLFIDSSKNNMVENVNSAITTLINSPPK